MACKRESTRYVRKFKVFTLREHAQKSNTELMKSLISLNFYGGRRLEISYKHEDFGFEALEILGLSVH